MRVVALVPQGCCSEIDCLIGGRVHWIQALQRYKPLFSIRAKLRVILQAFSWRPKPGQLILGSSSHLSPVSAPLGSRSYPPCRPHRVPVPSCGIPWPPRPSVGCRVEAAGAQRPAASHHGRQGGGEDDAREAADGARAAIGPLRLCNIRHTGCVVNGS